MMISKIAFHKRAIKYIFCCIALIGFFGLEISGGGMAHAEIRLPKLEAPDIRIPEVPAVPSPEMPAVKGIDIDTDKIANEIDGQAKAAGDKEKKSDSSKLPSGQDDKADKKAADTADKIKNNKYIKRGTSENTDAHQGDRDKLSASSGPEEAGNSGDSEPKDSETKLVTARELLAAGFIGVMFYIFSKTAFIAIVLWLGVLLTAKKLPAVLEIFAFSLLNIAAGIFYFPLAGKLDNGQLEFYGKVVTDSDFLVIMLAFSACALAAAGAVSILMTASQKRLAERSG